MSDPEVRFGKFVLHAGRRELTHDGEVIALESRVFDLLSYLIAHRDRMVGKDELMDAVWPGRIVTEAALARAVMKARKAVLDDASRQSVIRTVHGHGYHFVAECSEFEHPDAIASPESALPSPVQASSPEAPEGHADSARRASPEPGRNPRPVRWVAVAVVLVIAVGLAVLLPRNGKETADESAGPRIAVLPVLDRTGEPDLGWSRLGLMSFVRAQLAQAPEFQIVRDGDVVALADQLGWDGPLVGDAADRMVERLVEVQGITHALLLELESDVGGLRMNWVLRESDGRLGRGTMVGSEGTALAAGAVQAVYGDLLGRSRLARAAPLVSSDAFLNEAFSRGMAMSIEGRCGEAIRYFEVIIDDEPEAFLPRFEFASCLRILGRNDEAEPLLVRLVEEQRELGRDEPVAQALMTLGVLYNRTGRLDQAEETLSEALVHAESAGAWELAGRILQNQAIVVEDRNDWSGSEALLDRAVLAYRRAGREVLPGHIASHRANLAMDQGRLAEADLLLDEAIASFREAGDRRNEAMMLNNRGYLRREQGQLEDAQAFHEQSLAIRQEIGDRVGVGRIYGMLASVHSARGDHAAARDAAESAHSIAAEAGDRLYEGTALASLGDAQSSLGELDAARSSYEQSRSVFEAIDDTMRALMVELRIARLSLRAGDPSEAERVALRIQEEAVAAGLEQAELDALELLGDARSSAGRPDDARATYEQALEQVRQTGWAARESRLLIKLVGVCMDQQDWDAAAPLIGALTGQAATLASLRVQARFAAGTGNPAEAVALLEQGRQLADADWSQDDEALLSGYRAAVR